MKRQRNKEIIKQSFRNKKKLPITQFEDLSNELIYEIFDYFDYCFIYETFTNLNLRFQSLFINSSLPLKINFPLRSKSSFQYQCKHIITSNINRIISLNICKYFLDYFSINLFSSLKSLTIDQIQSEKIFILFNQLIALPYFSSLSIHSSNYFQDENSIYLLIFRLPKLKFCKLTFPSGGERISLPLSTNLYSPLEHFIINGNCRLDQLISILSYLPNLQHLSCQYLYSSGGTKIKVPLNLTSLHLILYGISFDELKFFLSKVSLRLKKLRITKSNDDNYFHAEQWEDLIRDYMPCLCTFDLQYSVFSDEYEDDSHQILINRFSTQFWIERKWFFDYYYYYKTENSRYLNFFSTVPYRYHHFVLHEQINDNEVKLCRNNNINFARHLTVADRLNMDKYLIQFPKVNKLTLANNNIEENPSFIDDLNSLIPLTQIKDLTIKDKQIPINELIEILYFLPNLESLTLSNIFFEEIETDNLFSKDNKITKLTIDDDEYELKHIHFLMQQFPNLQYLEIGLDENNLRNILRFLLSKSPSLFSLFLLNVNYRIVDKIQIFLKNEKLLDNYTIEHIHGGLYLWW